MARPNSTALLLAFDAKPLLWVALAFLLVLLLGVLSWEGPHQPCRVCGSTRGIRKTADLCRRHDS